jgi:DNA polymerase (family 10)
MSRRDPLDLVSLRNENPHVTRDALAYAMDEIATLLELRDENPFKIRAYRQGAEAVRSFDGDVVQAAAENGLIGVKGIGDALREKLHTLATSGTLPFLEDLRKQFPPGLFELFEIQGLGPKKIKIIHSQLGIDSIASLKQACEDGRVAALSGFGVKTQATILQSIASRAIHAGEFLLGRITPLASLIRDTLQSHPEVARVAIAGSFRRAKETVHDLDFLVETRSPALVCEDFCHMDGVESVLACGETKSSVMFRDGIQCDLRAVPPENFPFALQYFTGSKEHNVSLRSRALDLGLSLNEYGFSAARDSVDVPSGIRDEAGIYQALGLPFIEPELRENRGEFEAALTDSLPRLIQLENLRGTFHNHTIASDGSHTLEEMAAAAHELGLQYLGIADHSRSSAIANGLSEERLLLQLDEIQSLNATYDGFRILAGSEVDILRDGSLDYSDDILARLDYCVASVHQSFHIGEEEMTRRICRAMENPHVTMIGHLTGRLLLKRDPYALDILKIIDCAAETRTVIELNCNPQRLDMDWRWWKRARDKGVLCAINPDAHHTHSLHNLGLGIRLARKGWLRRHDVINTMGIDQIDLFLRTPKDQRDYIAFPKK